MPEDKLGSRNPYHDKDGKPVLKPSVLLLMDVLGYREIAKQAVKDKKQQQFVTDIFQALTEGRNWIEGPHLETTKKIVPKDNYALKTFTDNIVVGYPILNDAESEIGNAISFAMEFQFTMALKGFFVRGAISLGMACIDEIVVAGDALLDAYDAEISRARDPRIILTQSAKAAVKSHLSYYSDQAYAPQTREILRDSDGQWFVNYLEEVLIADNEVGPFYNEFLIHKAVVEANLAKYAEDPLIFSKYAWVAGYHNAFCQRYENWFSNEHMINTELFRAKPRSILDGLA